MSKFFSTISTDAPFSRARRMAETARRAGTDNQNVHLMVPGRSVRRLGGLSRQRGRAPHRPLRPTGKKLRRSIAPWGRSLGFLSSWFLGDFDKCVSCP